MQAFSALEVGLESTFISPLSVIRLPHFDDALGLIRLESTIRHLTSYIDDSLWTSFNAGRNYKYSSRLSLGLLSTFDSHTRLKMSDSIVWLKIL